MDYQIIADDTGKILAVLSYCTLSIAQEVARQYARVLGLNIYRKTAQWTDPTTAPRVGTMLPLSYLGIPEAVYQRAVADR